MRPAAQPGEAPREAAARLAANARRPGLDARLDRIDQAVRPGPHPHHPGIEGGEPAHLQQLRLAGLEQERGDRDADQLRQHEDPRAEQELPLGQQPQRSQLEREQQPRRNDEHEQHREGRQAVHPGRDRRLHPGQRYGADDGLDQRLGMPPQPGFDQEEDGEDRPEDAGKRAHGGTIPQSAPPRRRSGLRQRRADPIDKLA